MPRLLATLSAPALLALSTPLWAQALAAPAPTSEHAAPAAPQPASAQQRAEARRRC